MLSEERLDEIEAVAEAATEGPWENVTHTPTVTWTGWWKPQRLFVFAAYGSPQDGDPVGRCDIEANAAFIAAARTAVPELVAEVRRLRDGIEGLAATMHGGAMNGLNAVTASSVRDELRALLTDGSADDDDR